jgi:hypothetical protein
MKMAGAVLLSENVSNIFIKLRSSATKLYLQLLLDSDLELDKNSIDVNEILKDTKYNIFNNLKHKLPIATFYRAWKRLEKVGLLIDNKDGTFTVPMLSSTKSLIKYIKKEMKNYQKHGYTLNAGELLQKLESVEKNRLT